ncbi:DUF2842 domain-containing protein [Pseudomonas sp. GX19020]|uniref:DUF2842 domain-containing protein n=1 Tax=Pseudomonadota TaxID=1224 RepID=UPI00089CAB46|nr:MULTISPECIES: DUF2842 domain-containing protein [Pseudomonadota]MCL4066878.1 DUF2842 domain-containing protein [Pseudomonas sp. GX19020]SEB54704.1 Protein of unknown function [Rhodobacter sp. 24-YEA-8]
MALSYRKRKNLALLILVIGVPVYCFVTLVLIGLANDAWWSEPGERMPLFLEAMIFIGLGLAWALPLRRIFLGIGQPDPGAPKGP